MPNLLSVAFCKYLLASVPPNLDQLNRAQVSPAYERVAKAAVLCRKQYEATLEGWEGDVGDQSHQAALLQDLQETGYRAAQHRAGYSLGQPQAADTGSAQCRCIGIDNLPGNVTVALGGHQVQYPLSFGTHCDAWDAGVHPDCTGFNSAAWCGQHWCFVDPCSCNLATTPVVSSYFPDALSNGRPLYYSYATCGAVDHFTAESHDTACVNQASLSACSALDRCEWTLDRGCVGRDLAGANCAVTRRSDQAVLGNTTCPCIGIGGRNGTAEVTTIAGHGPVSYSGNIGSQCSAWDDDHAPDCQGPADTRPSWCHTSWCYVDPCNCGLDVAPKVNTYFPNARYHNNRVYYSYATCSGSGANQGAADTYTVTNNPNACVNQHSQVDCEAQGSGCLWALVSVSSGYQCRGRELATMCASSVGGSPFSRRRRGMLSEARAPAAAPALLLAGLLAALTSAL